MTTTYTNPKSGETIESKLSPVEAKLILMKISGASDFVVSIRNKINPSPAQAFWLIKLAETELSKQNPAPAGIVVGAFAKIAEMFKKASEYIKKPKILMEIGGIESKLSLAPSTGKNPGWIYLKVQGECAGKISPEGVFSPFNCPETIKEGIKSLAENPVSVAAAYGHETGNCCFCARELTKQDSLDVGYGEICSQHYGLPYGKHAGVR